MHGFLIAATAVMVLWTLLMIPAIYTSFIRPYRSKIFFSYSHRDNVIAERVMSYLDQYHFRTWIDFGKTIDSADLERELTAAMKPTEVVVVLSSVNSSNSRWVAFELLQATEHAKLGYRGITILALDDAGSRLQESLNEITTEQKKQDVEVLKVLSESDNWIFRSLLRGEFFASPQPGAKRLFDRQITLFDLRLRLPFEDVMCEVAYHLKAVTKMHRGAFLAGWRLFVIAMWLFGGLGLMFIWRLYSSAHR